MNYVQLTFLNINSGVPHCSVLGPLLFHTGIYVNNLVNSCVFVTACSNIYLYADNSKLFSFNKIVYCLL